MSQIETARLVLREWKDADFDSFVAMNQDPSVMKFFPDVLSKEDSHLLIDRITNHFNEWGYGFYAVELKSSNKFVGFNGLSHPRFKSDFTPCVEIGWRLVSHAWGKGLASEGARAVLNLAFEHLKLKEIYSFTPLENIASYRVMQKIGMKKLGTFFHPDLPGDHSLAEHWLYNISFDDWKPST